MSDTLDTDHTNLPPLPELEIDPDSILAEPDDHIEVSLPETKAPTPPPKKSRAVKIVLPLRKSSRTLKPRKVYASF